MAKMETVFRDEISRLARHEIKVQLEPIAKQLKVLKKEVRRLKDVVNKLGAKVPESNGLLLEQLVDLDEAKAARIGPKFIRSLRKRLGLSQRELSVLLGVSLSAVGTWEYGKARPEGKNRQALVTLRRMGRRQVKKILSNSL
ncbi:MAG: helix-turn-helix domain-containing protein [Deltaproteobacteria bacterium]|nr:helix-turn-helix domain-containing protein [Deltaproteobacteria bacterium]